MSAAVERKLAAASFLLLERAPYLAAALWSVRRIPTDRVPTMAVDAHWRLYVNPVWMSSLTTDETQAVLCHELHHLIRDHASRRPVDTDPALWNVAADLEINDDLVAEHMALPEGALLPRTFALPTGLTAEEYALRLKARALPADPLVACGCCGEGAGGAVAVPIGDVVDGVGVAESMLLRRQVARAICSHAGQTPVGLRRWADTHLAPKIDWRRELAARVRTALADVSGAADYRYARPSRRSAACPGLILPSLRRPVPEVAVVVDTSGSMGNALLARCLAEVQGILRAAGARDGVPVLAVDAAVHATTRVHRAAQVRLAGGGGTDMGVGIDAARRLRPQPTVVIVLTDGYTPWPATPPVGIRVVVGLLGGGVTPAWAKAVRVDTEGETL